MYGSYPDAGEIKVIIVPEKRHENYCIAEPGTTGSFFCPVWLCNTGDIMLEGIYPGVPSVYYYAFGFMKWVRLVRRIIIFNRKQDE